jgi:pentatricopeptide repeat protein
MAYLNTGKYNEAIDYLNKFKSDDIVLSGLATGAIGDAYAEDNKPEEH